MSSRNLSSAQSSRVTRIIRELWKSLGTQRRVGEVLGVSQQTVSMALAGRGVSPETARAVTRVVNRSYAEVIGEPRCQSRWYTYECDFAVGHDGFHQTAGGFTRWPDSADTRETVDGLDDGEVPAALFPETQEDVPGNGP